MLYSWNYDEEPDLSKKIKLLYAETGFSTFLLNDETREREEWFNNAYEFEKNLSDFEYDDKSENSTTNVSNIELDKSKNLSYSEESDKLVESSDSRNQSRFLDSESKDLKDNLNKCNSENPDTFEQSNDWDMNFSNKAQHKSIKRERRAKEKKRKESMRKKQELEKKANNLLKPYKKVGWLPRICFPILILNKLAEIKFVKKEKKVLKRKSDNELFNMIKGLFYGIILGFAIYFLLVYTLINGRDAAIYAAASVMVISGLLCAYSPTGRIIIILCLPKLISGKIQSAAILIALMLVSTGPMLNIIRNSNSMRNSVSCVVGQMQTNMKVLEQVVRAPFRIIANSIKQWVAKANNLQNRIRDMIKGFSVSLLKFRRVIDKQKDWVLNLARSCSNKEALKNLCLSMMNDIYFNCKATMSFMAWICSTLSLTAERICLDLSNEINTYCYDNEKSIEYFINEKAQIYDKDLESTSDEVIKIIGDEDLLLQVKDIEVDENLVKLDTKFDKNLADKIAAASQMTMNMIETIKYIIKTFTVVLVMISLLLLLTDAVIFYWRWKKQVYFQNQFLTEDFFKQEYQALSSDMPSALPLRRKERINYVRYSSLYMTKFERYQLYKGFSFLFVFFSTVGSVYAFDYFISYILETTKAKYNSGFSHADIETGMASEIYKLPHNQDSDSSDMKLNSFAFMTDPNSGVLSQTINDLMMIFKPFSNLAPDIDAERCMPIVFWADNSNYNYVILACVFAVLFVPVEIYMSRLRHKAMEDLYPNIAAKRGSWLRAYIRNNRGLLSHIKHNIKLNKGFSKILTLHRYTMLGRYIFKNPQKKMIFKRLGLLREFCALCGKEGFPRKGDFKADFQQCSECAAFFCQKCNLFLRGFCHVCKVPIQLTTKAVKLEKMDLEEDYDFLVKKYFVVNKDNKWNFMDLGPKEKKQKLFERYMNNSTC